MWMKNIVMSIFLQEGNVAVSHPSICCSMRARMLRQKFREILPIFLLVAYSAVGGLIFWTIEGENARMRQNSVAVKSQQLANDTSWKIVHFLVDQWAKSDNASVRDKNYATTNEILNSIRQMLHIYSRWDFDLFRVKLFTHLVSQCV